LSAAHLSLREKKKTNVDDRRIDISSKGAKAMAITRIIKAKGGPPEKVVPSRPAS